MEKSHVLRIHVPLSFDLRRACSNSDSLRYSRMLPDARRAVDGARDRTRTGKELPPRDFRTRYSFRCPANDGLLIRWSLVWSLDFLFVVSRDGREPIAKVRQGPSSLYTFLGVAQA